MNNKKKKKKKEEVSTQVKLNLLIAIISLISSLVTLINSFR